VKRYSYTDFVSFFLAQTSGFSSIIMAVTKEELALLTSHLGKRTATEEKVTYVRVGVR
jgi:hypothetical protein